MLLRRRNFRVFVVYLLKEVINLTIRLFFRDKFFIKDLIKY